MSELIVNTISGLSDLSVGNTTVNSTVNSTSFSIGNTSITGDTLSVGNTTVNSTVNSTSFSIGNTSITGDTLSVGNTTVNTSSVAIGNSTVNTAITSSGITQNGLNFKVPKNYIVNPGMRISQENGSSSSTASGYFTVDQWKISHFQNGTLTTQQVSSATPGGSENRIRMTVTSADTSIAAGQYAFLVQPIEGLRTADLQWGTANATDVVLRFGFKGPAGTYAVAIINQDNNRSFVREFTISGGDANIDTLQTLTFPGDTSGTWDKDNTSSLKITFTFAAGSNWQTTPDAWQAGNYRGTASTSNGIGTTSDVFELFDVGLYADPDSTGLAPRFELPHYDTDLAECQRYFCVWHTRWTGVSASANYRYSAPFSYPVEMRSTPAAGVISQTNSARYPSSAYAVGINKYGGYAYYTAQSSGGNDAWTVTGTANARM